MSETVNSPKDPTPPVITDTPVSPPVGKKSSKKQRTIFIIAGSFVIVILIALVTYLLYNNKTSKYSSKETTTPTPVATRSPKPIPHGKVGFAVSQSDKTKPQFGAGEIDPYDPEKDSVQTVKIAVKDTVDIVSVNAILKTDNETSQPVAFTLVEGTAQMGIWQGSWKVTDSYLYTYNLILNATSSRGISTVEVTLR